MKITVLAYTEAEGSRECDIVHGQVVRALKKQGHDVSLMCIHGDVSKLISGLNRRKPDLVFNLVESFADDMLGGLMGVAAVLDLLQIPYTGGGPGELYLQEDKGLSKKLLAYDEVLYPHFATFAKNADFETGGRLRMPLFVKPLRSDASIGIDAKTSLVHNAQELMEQVLRIHNEVNDSALAEEYIEGREFYVGVLGNQEPVAFPPVEMDFSGLPEGTPRVLDAKAKFDESSEEYQGTRAVMAELDDVMKAKMQQVALNAYRAVRVRDYGRIDLRLTDAGEIYVIEVNASCYLEEQSEFAMAAAAAGIEYGTLVNRITQLAMDRWKAPKQPTRRKQRGSGDSKRREKATA